MSGMPPPLPAQSPLQLGAKEEKWKGHHGEKNHPDMPPIWINYLLITYGPLSHSPVPLSCERYRPQQKLGQIGHYLHNHIFDEVHMQTTNDEFAKCNIFSNYSCT